MGKFLALAGVVCTIGAVVGVLVAKTLRPTVPGYESTQIPGLFVRQHNIDVGLISPDRLVEVRFDLLNRGKRSLKIEKVTAACGCTAADLSQRMVKSGGNLSVPLKMDASRFGGTDFKKAVLVQFEPDKPDKEKNLMFTLTGQIDRTGELYIWPGILDFGDVRVGQTARKTVYFRAGNTLPAGLPEIIRINELPDAMLKMPVPQTLTKTQIRAVDFELTLYSKEAGFTIEKISSDLPVNWIIQETGQNNQQTIKITVEKNMNLAQPKCGSLNIELKSGEIKAVPIVLVPIGS
ncbi:MAG: hypothetical protein AMJ79_04560 [Phycisphaerae bacterium SM23_30]|nr:MAG: hypothetical protein AMJ79_04560 [Phycisphaerae bacterium SM23_30]